MRKFLTILVSLVMAVVAPMSTYALTETQLEMFAQNNILFYDPGASTINCYSQNLSGDTIMAKVVNYLSGNNPSGFVLSDNGVAGVLANFQGESGFNPFKFESDKESGPGYGIAQWTPASTITGPLSSDTRTASYFNEYYDVKYSKNNSDTGLPKESVPMEVVDAWLSVELDYGIGGESSEFENTKVGTYRHSGGEMGLDYITDDMTIHEAMDAAKTPEDATRIYTWIFERPGDKEAAASKRSGNAQQWLDYTENIRAVSNGVSSTVRTTNGNNVTIIGDSITELSRSEIKKLLPEADIHAQSSKHFYDFDPNNDNPGGYTILTDLVDSDELRDLVVFALGTNDPAVTLEQAKDVVDKAGPSRKVVFMTNYTEEKDYSSNNNVFLKMANDNPGRVLIADWKSAIEGQSYLGSDGIHPKSPEGTSLFASIIANTVNSVSNVNTVCLDSRIEGGLANSQAERLRDYYNSDEVSAEEWNLPYTKMNCVSFTAFFVQRFTSVGHVSRTWGNGKDVANNLAQEYGLQAGTAPRPFAVFSVTKGNMTCGSEICGHTGIVVSVKGDQVTTIEAAFQTSNAEVKTHDASYFVNDDYGNTFTYLDSILDKNALMEVTGY